MAVACILIAIAYTCYVQLAAVMQCGTSRGCQVLIFALFTLFSFWRMTRIRQARWLIGSLRMFSVTYGCLLKFQRSVKRLFKREVKLDFKFYSAHTSIVKIAML